MEYERIEKVQTGVISPSKLRLKLIGGPHHHRKKEGSNNNSSRTSPSKLEDLQFVKNSLLDSNDGGGYEEGVSNDFIDNASILPSVASSALKDAPVKLPSEGSQDSSQGDETTGFYQKENSTVPKELIDTGHVKTHRSSKVIGGNMSLVHPVRASEEENLDYDSNASSSSFEFHKGERLLHNPVVRPFTRHVPSKWNDAEKWIVNKQLIIQPHVSKKNLPLGQANRQQMTSWLRTSPESINSEPKALSIQVVDSKKINPCHQLSQNVSEKFSFASSGTGPNADPTNDTNNGLIDLYPLSKDWKEVANGELEGNRGVHFAGTAAAGPAIKSVLMRDMGTEMTPIPSQDPSRTSTPVLATTPIRSPTSSIPSTPRQGTPASTPLEDAISNESDSTRKEGSKNELSEREKTRREIVALGVQLGKMNIAAWASEAHEKESKNPRIETIIDREKHDRIEFERRAEAWEEAEKSKHAARYKREEIRIQAWESNQKAKLEASLIKVEAQVEQMRNNAQEKMTKKIEAIRQRSEEKRAAAEAKKNRQAAKAAAQADYIRETGHIPSSSHFICCGWLS